jgi:hypothetical protein
MIGPVSWRKRGVLPGDAGGEILRPDATRAVGEGSGGRGGGHPCASSTRHPLLYLNKNYAVDFFLCSHAVPPPPRATGGRGRGYIPPRF